MSKGTIPKQLSKKNAVVFIVSALSDLAPLLDWESIRERAEGYKVRGPST